MLFGVLCFCDVVLYNCQSRNMERMVEMSKVINWDGPRPCQFVDMTVLDRGELLDF